MKSTGPEPTRPTRLFETVLLFGIVYIKLRRNIGSTCVPLGRFSGQSAVSGLEKEKKREEDEGGGKCLQMGSLTLELFSLTGAPRTRILKKLDVVT